MRSVALRSLLINLEVIKPLYVKTAIGILRNRIENWELRLTAFSSISHVYFQKRPAGIMSILSIILKDKNEHFNIRLSAFDAILRVYGYATQELLLKNYIILLVQEEKYLNFDEFLKEKMHDFKGDFVSIGKLIESDFTNFMFDT